MLEVSAFIREKDIFLWRGLMIVGRDGSCNFLKFSSQLDEKFMLFRIVEDMVSPGG